MRPLAVTGLGVVSPLGVGFDAFARGLAGPVAHAPTTSLFDASPYEGARFAEVQGFDASKHLGATGLRNNDRLTKLLLVAARLALAAAGVKEAGRWLAYGPDEVGAVAATAYGSLEAIHELELVAKLEDPRYLNPARFPNTVINSSLGYVSIWEELRALNTTVVSGPPGALDAASTAELYLTSRRAKALLVGGAEALSEPLALGFHRAGWSRGAALGEGAALAVLEPAAAARARGASVHASLIGYGTAFDPREGDERVYGPSSEAMERAVRSALRDASVAPAEVDVVLTGASGVPSMDAAELGALARVMPSGACVTSPKERHGETFGAAGALALATAVAWMKGAPVTCVREGRGPAEVRTALVTALGIHGNASALVVRRPE